MDQRAVVIVDIVEDGNTFSFHMPLGAQWASAHKAAIKVVEEIEKEVAELQKKHAELSEQPESVDKAE